jgi:ABC-type nitrate/sulfonate/bicarbonate transport system substrate-binding protein
MSMARASALSFLWLMAALGAACAQAQTQVPTKVRLGLTRTLIVGATNTAIEKGYFREFGIDVDVNYLDGSANSLFLLAQNELQVVEGAHAARGLDPKASARDGRGGRQVWPRAHAVSLDGGDQRGAKAECEQVASQLL